MKTMWYCWKIQNEQVSGPWVEIVSSIILAYVFVEDFVEKLYVLGGQFSGPQPVVAHTQ